MIEIALTIICIANVAGLFIIYHALRDKTDPVDVHVDASITLNSDTRGLL